MSVRWIPLSTNSDWRITNQEKYLKDKCVKRVYFRKHSSAWDHDHCEFCHNKFDSDTQEAFCTLDEYHWICEKCFIDFQTIFNWQVVD